MKKKFTLKSPDGKNYEVQATRSGNEWKALCPFHEDTIPSLSINCEKEVYFCHGCGKSGKIENSEVIEADEPREVVIRNPVIENIYDYRDEEGNLLYQTVRYRPKDFKFRRPDGSGGWIYNIEGVRRVLYKLPELINADKSKPVLVVEGEKDVDNLTELGFVATTSPMGGGEGKWRVEYNEYFYDRDVILIPDNDDKGRTHCKVIGNSLRGIAKSVKWLELPNLEEKEDFSDWLGKGGTKEELLELIKNAEIYRSELERVIEEVKRDNHQIITIDFSVLAFGGDFINQYIKYASKITDAPLIYHEVVGLLLLATITEGRITFRGINTNLYTVLVGKSTIMRKSVSINIGVKILYKIDSGLIIPSDFSPEAFFDRLAADPRGLIYWSEFGQFLSISGRSYMAGIKEVITDLFDCPEERKRILRKSEIIIRNPYLCIATATTKAWIKVDINDLIGGFLGRFIFINAEPSEKDRDYIVPPESDKEGEAKIINKLIELRQLEFEMFLSGEAEALYKEFKEGFSKEIETINDEKGETSFLGRLEIYVLKLAMLYQISENPQNEIGERAMERAIKLVTRAKRDILELLENQLGNSQFENDRQRVLNFIRKNRLVDRTTLMRNMRNISKKYLDKILETLFEAELVEEITEEAVGRKPRRCYRIIE